MGKCIAEMRDLKHSTKWDIHPFTLQHMEYYNGSDGIWGMMGYAGSY